MTGLDFNKIYNRYEKPIYNYVWRLVGEQPIAEDLTQEIFIKVYRNLTGFQGKSKLSTWIYKIATNACIDYFRTSAYKRQMNTVDIEDQNINNSTHDETESNLSIEDLIIKDDMKKCIHQCVDDLPSDYRSVIVLHDLQGFKNREIAEILDASIDNVKIRLHRARKKLRSVFSSNCD
ncbi:MAG: RNA polymerase sigma factor, partial [Fidelibacterota bacterium]